MIDFPFFAYRKRSIRYNRVYMSFFIFYIPCYKFLNNFKIIYLFSFTNKDFALWNGKITAPFSICTFINCLRLTYLCGIVKIKSTGVFIKTYCNAVRAISRSIVVVIPFFSNGISTVLTASSTAKAVTENRPSTIMQQSIRLKNLFAPIFIIFSLLKKLFPPNREKRVFYTKCEFIILYKVNFFVFHIYR